MPLAELSGFIKTPTLATVAIAVCAVVVVLLLHALATSILGHLLPKSTYLHAFLKGSANPRRLLLSMLALQAVLATAQPDFPWLSTWRHFILLLLIAAGTWLPIDALIVIRHIIALRYPANVADNLIARRIQTQTTVLIRVLSGVLVIFGVSAALMTFPSVRQIGASLLASAGLAGLVVGFAAKPVLGNLIAGLQIAVAQPLRIDDVVIIEGE